MSLAAVILAAGASRRMGTPKALLELHGETFLDRLIGVFGEHCAPVIVVLGHQADAIRPRLRRVEEAVFVVNPDPERGQLSSLQCGLRAVPEDARGVMFTPVDYPAVQPETVRRLAGALTGDCLVAIPRFGGRRGHPVAAVRELAGEWLALPVEAQARDVIHRYAERTCYVDVEDPGILHDVDDPEAYRNLLRAAQS